MFITIVAFYGLMQHTLPKWVYLLLLAIGLGGAIVDGLIIFVFHF